MEKCLNIPLDFRSRTPFRVLRRALTRDGDAEGGAVRAAGLVLLLTGELGYAAEKHPVGFVPEPQMRLFLEDLPDLPEALSALTAPDCYLQAAEGGWVCPDFAACNRHLAPGHMTLQQQGGHARAIKYKRDEAERAAQQQSLLIDREVYLRPTDGTAMDSEEINRVMTIIKLFDNVLKRRARLTNEFSQGLVQDAWRVRQEYSDADINAVASWLNAKAVEGHPSLPANTETLLRTFRRFVPGSAS